MLDFIRSKSQSYFVKIIFGIIILTFVFLGVGNFSKSSSSSVATINGEDISTQDFIQLYSPVVNRVRTQNPDFFKQEGAEEQLKQQVLAELVDETLKRQEAEKLGLFVTPHELIEDLTRTFPFLRDEAGKFSLDNYKKYLEQIRFTPAQFEKLYTNNLLGDKLLSLVASSVGVSDTEARNFFNFALEKRTAQYVLFDKKDYIAKVVVEDAAIAAYYEKHKAAFSVPAQMDVEYIVVTPKTLAASVVLDDAVLLDHYNTNKARYSEPAQYKAKHIFLSAPPENVTEPGSAEKIAKAKEKIEDIAKQIAAGASFEEMAKQFSDDKKSGENGGELNWMAKGTFPLAGFEDAAMALSANEISGVVRTPVGFHIIKLVDKKADQVKDFAAVKDSIKAELALQKGQEAETQARNYVVDELAKGTDFTTIAKHLNVPLEKTGLMEKEALRNKLALHADALISIESIPVGEVAPAPVNVADGVALVKVLASTPERTLSLEESKNDITAIIQKEQAGLLAMAAAEAAGKEFTGTDVPENFKKSVKVSQPFYRVLPFVPPLAGSQKLIEQLSTVPTGQWLTTPCETDAGAVIARVNEVIPVTEKEWEEQGSEFTQSYWQGKQVEAVGAFTAKLRAASTVTVNPEVLESIRFTN